MLGFWEYFLTTVFVWEWPAAVSYFGITSGSESIHFHGVRRGSIPIILHNRLICLTMTMFDVDKSDALQLIHFMHFHPFA